MIWLATNKAIRRMAQHGRWTGALAGRFVAGGDLAAARRRIDDLRQDGIVASIYYLGEYVTTRDLVEQNVLGIMDAIESFPKAASPHFLSIDPTQIGYSISDDLGCQNALRIGHALAERGNMRFLMIDMEDSSYVARSIALHQKLGEEGVPVALTLQSYLYRTREDMRRLGRQGAAIRICKGAFIAAKDIAWARKRDIEAAFLRDSRTLLSPEMKAAGAYPIIATHDERMIRALIPELKRNAWRSDQYEFELLLGMREGLQRRLAREGHTVRVYVPFGTEWWPYTVRRIGENPANALFALRALFSRQSNPP
jgi:proline dehydrogenase